MTELKIKLKFGEFEFEIEGDKESVIEEFKSIRENGISKLIESIKPIATKNEVEERQEEIPKEQTDGEEEVTKKAKNQAKKNGKKVASRIPKQLMDLNLRPNGKMSLKDFYNSYQVKTNFEKNLVYVYYLIKKALIQNIGIDHIYTCYKEAGQKIPDNLYQSLADTKKHKAWINTTNFDDITLGIQGENHIEHDMNKAKGK